MAAFALCKHASGSEQQICTTKSVGVSMDCNRGTEAVQPRTTGGSVGNPVQ